MKRWAVLGLVAAIACGGEQRPAEVAPAPETPPAAGPVTARTVTPEGEVLEAEYGRAGQLPTDFPGDVPLYGNARPMSSMASAEHGTVVSLRSSDPADAVFAWYREHYPRQGWSIEHAGETGTRSTVVARKGSRMSSVAIQSLPDATQVLLIVVEDR